MKKLLIFCFCFPFFAAAQGELGINEEHLVIYQSTLRHQHFTAQKIRLKTGVELEFVEKGSPTGIPVLFLHGIGDSWHSFETVLPHLPHHFRAIALSQRGHGNSDKPSQGYTPKQFAADAAAFIEQLHLGPVIMVGHSMGGVNAQQFALDHPKLLKALVLVDTDVSFRNNPGLPAFQQVVMQLEDPISREFMVAFQSGTLANPIDSAWFDVLVDEALKVPAPVFKAAFKGFMEVDYAPRLKTITAPALIFWGDQDGFCLRPGQDILQREIKNAKLLVYEGTGHALHWEEPARFAKDLTQFIDSLPQ